jgi:hypothetical protein
MLQKIGLARQIIAPAVTLTNKDHQSHKLGMRTLEQARGGRVRERGQKGKGGRIVRWLFNINIITGTDRLARSGWRSESLIVLILHQCLDCIPSVLVLLSAKNLK